MVGGLHNGEEGTVQYIVQQLPTSSTSTSSSTTSTPGVHMLKSVRDNVGISARPVASHPVVIQYEYEYIMSTARPNIQHMSLARLVMTTV